MKVMNPDTSQLEAGEVAPDKGQLRVGFLGGEVTTLKDTFTSLLVSFILTTTPELLS
jgi:hypothetical protein